MEAEGSGVAEAGCAKKKVRKRGGSFSGEVLLQPRVEDWMEDESLRTSQGNYKDSLMKNITPSWCDLDEGSEGKTGGITTGFDDVVEPAEGISVDLSDPLCPNFVLADSEKERLLKPFKRTLIVKMLGSTANYDFMCGKFAQIWGKVGKIRVFDLPNDFYLVKFQSQEDYDVALTGGPWVVADCYLSVMRWRADFNPRKEVVDRVVAWVRLPDLPATHYDMKFLYNLGNVIGKAIRVDVPTAQRGRGKFARMCVELDLSKPLVPRYSIEGQVFSIEYECMNLLCLHCGRFGHVKDACGDFIKLQEGRQRSSGEREKETVVEKTEVEGSEEMQEIWKVVQKPWRRRSTRPVTRGSHLANRFELLKEGVGIEKGGRPLEDVTNWATDKGREMKGRFGESRFKGRSQEEGRDRGGWTDVVDNRRVPSRVRGGLKENHGKAKTPQGLVRKDSVGTGAFAKQVVEETSTSGMLVDTEEGMDGVQTSGKEVEEGELRMEEVRRWADCVDNLT